MLCFISILDSISTEALNGKYEGVGRKLQSKMWNGKKYDLGKSIFWVTQRQEGRWGWIEYA